MKTYLDCIPCFFEQALRAGRAATNDDKLIKQLMDELGIMLKDISFESTPPANRPIDLSGRAKYYRQY